MHVYRESLSIRVCKSFPFGFEGRIWGLIVLILDHSCRFTLTSSSLTLKATITTAADDIQAENQDLFSSKDKSKKIKMSSAAIFVWRFKG